MPFVVDQCADWFERAVAVSCAMLLQVFFAYLRAPGP